MERKGYIFFATLVIFLGACGQSSTQNTGAAPIVQPIAAQKKIYKTDPNHTLQQHIEALWEIQTRPGTAYSTDKKFPALPHPFRVANGQTDELSYWESYFVMLGMQAAGQREKVAEMVENFAFLIDHFGYVPMVNQVGALGRSNPPMFSLMVKMLNEMSKGMPSPLVQYMPQMEKEHAFWMSGASALKEDFTAHQRVVRVGYGGLLNRYFEENATPRPESPEADRVAATAYIDRPIAETYQHFRAASESSWGLSSRWGANINRLGSVETADLLPVDLNCLLWHLELTLSEAATQAGDDAKAQRYGKMAYDRRRTIRDMFFEKNSQFFQDFHWQNKNLSGQMTLAGVLPLFMEIADKAQVAAVAKTLEEKFLRYGGLVSSLERSGFAMDMPHCTAPLTYFAVEGLRKNGYEKLADEIQKRWMANCERIFKINGKILELYNVETTAMEGLKNEYSHQDGHGATNGVLYYWLKKK